MPVHFGVEADSRSIPSWSAHSWCKRAVSHRILSFDVCRERKWAKDQHYISETENAPLGETDLQLLHPVLTFGLLVRARFCLGGASDGDGEDMMTDTGCGWWVMASSGAMAKETGRSNQCAPRCDEAHS